MRLHPQQIADMSDFLRDRLRDVGRTQQQFADAIHRDRVVATRIINGSQPLKLDQLQAAAKLLELSIADLLSGLGVDPGLPAIDADLLADCLSIIQRKAKDMPPQVQARMTATLYDQARQHPELLASMDATAETLVRFARAGG